MDDTPTWPDYVNWAIQQAGTITNLAARAGLHRATISDWRSGRTHVNTATIGSILAVADAIGDNHDRALRAAGRVATPSTPTPAAAPHPNLADQIRRIRDLRLSYADTLAAIDQLLAAYERARRSEPPATDDDGQQRHTA